jgi:hypothetical protein
MTPMVRKVRAESLEVLVMPGIFACTPEGPGVCPLTAATPVSLPA